MKKSLSKIDIILFGLKLGILGLINREIRAGFKRLILPVNYWRVSIFEKVVNFIMSTIPIFNGEIKILDIGSPKLLSLLLGSLSNARIYATDLQDITIFTEWKKLYSLACKRNNVIFEFANARELPYPDSYFDIVYSISVIHMIAPGENGDIIALQEIQKKIRPGGLLIIEVPYRTSYRENYACRDNFEEAYTGKPVFQERQYDEKAIANRVLDNISVGEIQKIYLYERIPFDSVWSSLPRFFTSVFAFLEPWADILNICVANNTNQIEKAKSVILFVRIKK